MAKGDLVKLVKKAEKELMKDTEWYRSFFDIQTHQFTMTLHSVLEAVRNEVGDNIFGAHYDSIEALARTYIADVYTALTKKKAVVVNINGDRHGFTATIEAKEKGSVKGKAFKPVAGGGTQLYYPTEGTNVFRHINDSKREPQKKLVNGLNALFKGKPELTSESFIDTGHDVGVAEKQVRTALSKLNASIARKPEVAAIAAREARLEILSKFQQGSKKFVISVVEESAKSNRSKATQEKEFLNQTRVLLNKFVNDVDWANQGGSDSKVQQVQKALHNKIVEIGGTGTKKKVNAAASDANTKIKGKNTNTRSNNREKLLLKKPEKSNANLLALLNARLPPAVRARMVAPALVNRTGTFANSVKIANIVRSPQGFLTLQYDYQRNPYNVFDPVLGATPWANSNRDPKQIINAAIRDVAAGLIRERFYTRRF